MSVDMMAIVWKLELDHPEQAVLLALADHSFDDGSNCYPGIPYLAWKTGYSQRQIKRILHNLEASNLIRVIKNASRYTPTHYLLQLENGVPKKPLLGRGDKASLLINRGDKVGISGVTKSSSGVTPKALRGDKSSTLYKEESSYNHQKNHKRNIAAKAASLSSFPFPVPYPEQPSLNTVKDIFDHWREVCNHPHARLDESRYGAIVWALQYYTPEQIKFTCYGYASDAWAQGLNGDGVKHDDIKLICSNAEHVERFLDGFYDQQRTN